MATDVAEAQATIQAALEDYFLSREPFIVGLSSLPREDRVTEAAVAGIVDEAANSVGATVTTVTLTPGPAQTLSDGQKAKLGSLTFP